MSEIDKEKELQRAIVIEESNRSRKAHKEHIKRLYPAKNPSDLEAEIIHEQTDYPTNMAQVKFVVRGGGRGIVKINKDNGEFQIRLFTKSEHGPVDAPGCVGQFLTFETGPNGIMEKSGTKDDGDWFMLKA